MKYEASIPTADARLCCSFLATTSTGRRCTGWRSPFQLPKGTKMFVTAHYDNSEKNKYNPDPTKAVRFGDPTYDEMMVGYFDFVNRTRKIVKAGSCDLRQLMRESTALARQFHHDPREGDKLMFTAPGLPRVEAYP